MFPFLTWHKTVWIVLCVVVMGAVIGCSTPGMQLVPDLVRILQNKQGHASVFSDLKSDLAGKDLLGGLLIVAGSFVTFTAYQGCMELFVTVPDVTNLSLEEAEEQLLLAELKSGSIFEAQSATVPSGKVISQTPEAGTKKLSGTEVDLLLSLGPQLETVPDVTGKLLEEAQKTLEHAGFTVGDINYAYSSSVAKDIVISQEPEGGSDSLPASPVNLLVSLGEEYVTVPDVIGKSREEAETLIAEAGMRIGAITLKYSETTPENTVISQSPAGGVSVVRDSSMDLVISEGPQPVTVPALVGETESDAKVLISGSGFVVGVVTRVYSDTIPAGIVISQEPEAGIMKPPGTSVDIVVSQGPEPMAVPDVLGKSLSEATAVIVSAGFSLGRVVQGYSETEPAGAIISQNPVSGTMMPPGTTINLVISQGPEPVAVPDIIGDPEADALALITGAGFVPGVISREWNSTVPTGRVISQNPASGTVMPPGTTVDFVVSLGPEPVAVPNVTGITQEQAQTALTGVGLKVGVITLRYSDTAPKGMVTNQDPAAGVLVSPGTAVSLFVSNGPQPVPVPSIVGKTQTEAQRILAETGFGLGAITQMWSATVPSGTVISQEPLAGALAIPGSLVSFVVSKGPQPVNVPSVTGILIEEARTLITNAGLIVGVITQEYNADVAEDVVLRQQPAGGVQVMPGSSVSLVTATKRIRSCEYYPIAVGNKWEVAGDGGYNLEVSERLLINGYECWKMSGVEYTSTPAEYTAYAVYINGWIYMFEVFSDLYKLPQISSSATRLYPDYITPGVPFYFKYSGINFEVMPEKGRFSDFVSDVSQCPYGDVEETIALKLGDMVVLVMGRNLGVLWQMTKPSFTTSITIVGGCGITP